MNDFYPTMSLKVFNNLCNRYQIPKHFPLWLPRKFKKCYSGRTADVDMYDAIHRWIEVAIDGATPSTR